MRSLNMIIGILFVGIGILMIAGLNGVTFLSVAFLLGLLFMIAGALGCLSYRSQREDSLDKTWILVDGLTTFGLGFLIITNRLAADVAVPLVLGLWVMITGLRNMIRALEKIDVKDSYFYGHLSIGVINLIAGIYMFFNNDLLQLPTGVLVGICVITHGLNILMVGATVLVVKSGFIMNKEEMIEAASVKVEEAHEAAKQAIAELKEAKANVAIIEETPEELLDAAMAPKPTAEEAVSDENVEAIKKIINNI